MKISFLVTYYNQKEFVRQSMDSILALEKPCDWEILVGDDGSTDGTIDVVKEYIAKYPDNIFLYVMDRDPDKQYEIVRRSSANRLNLVDHMTGDYFCVMDGDDFYCHTGFVSQALDIFAQQPDISVVAFGYRTFSDNAGILSSYTLPPQILDTFDYLSQGMYTHAAACVFKNYMTPERKAYLNKIVYYDDNNIVINNLFFGELYAVAEVIYAYRQTDDSTYNTMQFAERAVLNAQSFDVDILLLPQARQSLMIRYSGSLLQTWFLRGSLKRLLGAQKWKRYCDGCGQLESKVTLAMLDASQTTPEVRKQARQIIWHLIKKHPKTAFKEFLRCLKYFLH